MSRVREVSFRLKSCDADSLLMKVFLIKFPINFPGNLKTSMYIHINCYPQNMFMLRNNQNNVFIAINFIK